MPVCRNSGFNAFELQVMDGWRRKTGAKRGDLCTAPVENYQFLIQRDPLKLNLCIRNKESPMAKRPGGELATRPLHFIWIADCFGPIEASSNAIIE